MDRRSIVLSVSLGLFSLLEITVLSGIVAGQLKAEFVWSMAKRAREGARYYQRIRHAYSPSYVHPRGWAVYLDACLPKDAYVPSPIVAYTWEIEQLHRLKHMGYVRRFTTHRCRVAATGAIGSPRIRRQQQPRQPLSPQRLRDDRSMQEGDTKGPRAAATVRQSVSRQLVQARPLERRRQSPLPGGRPLHPEIAPMLPDREPIPPPPDQEGDPDPYEWEIIPKLPALGSYEVTLTVKNKLGNEATTRQVITLKDYLIVVIGDSYASGQGNPDVNGLPEEVEVGGLIPTGYETHCETTKAAGKLIDVYGKLHAPEQVRVPMKRPPVWIEARAWRSYKSGHVLAAVQLEDEDPHSSVTLIHYASAGAKIRHLITLPQRQFQERKCNSFRTAGACGQLREVRETIGNRRIDALIISIGGNDAGFSKVLIQSVKGELRGSEEESFARTAIASLRSHYRRLATEIRNQLNGNVGQIYITGYPVDVFSNRGGDTDDGCGVFDTRIAKIFGFPGTSLTDALVMKDLGTRLNNAIAQAALENDWIFVPIGDGFLRHGYCTGRQNYFRGAEHSCETQGDIDGTMHPNELGHGRVYKSRLVQALRQHTFRERPVNVLKRP